MNRVDLVALRRARDAMDRDYAQPLDVAALARGALMSTGHFARLFRAAFGETPYSYLMTRRIERAKALLRQGNLSVTEVCLAVGCSSLGSFSSRFTELVGQTPSAYRARDHRDSAGIPGCVAMIATRPGRRGERLGDLARDLTHDPDRDTTPDPAARQPQDSAARQPQDSAARQPQDSAARQRQDSAADRPWEPAGDQAS